MDATAWNIGPVTGPAELVAASALFDNPVTPGGAQAFLAMPGHHLLLARAGDGTAAGFVSGVLMRHPDKDAEMFIYELAVDEPFRRRGVAGALVRALGERALALGCTGMWTGTERGNAAALATYRSLGAAVDAGSVFIVWDALAQALAPVPGPRPSPPGE